MRHWNWTLCAVLLLASTTTSAQEHIAGTVCGYAGSPRHPEVPGYHQLVYQYRDGETQRSMPFLLYLPQGFGQQNGPGKWPLVICLSGLGERGRDPRLLFLWGIAHDLLEKPDLQAWAPFMVLMPQCPTDGTWKTPQVAKAADALINQVMARWPVDQDRVYLTGLSLGGGGCWPVARLSPKRYAAIASIAGGSNEPEATVAALSGSGATCLIISGELDPRSAPGSAAMAKALRSSDMDVVEVVVPQGEHALWPAYYGNRQFHDWLLAHRRGAPPPAGRLTAEQLTDMGTLPPDLTRLRLNGELQAVARYWQVDNWGTQARVRPGLRFRLGGKSTVFVVSPKSGDIPCRLMTSITLPSPKPQLHLEVGHAPQGRWLLLVQVNEKVVAEQMVGPHTSQAGGGWITLDVDLSEHAGKDVRLQLVAMAAGAEDAQTWWRKVEITGY